MNNYFSLIFKCIFFYFVIIIALRLMGKREIGELNIFDIVIYLVMSELLALSLTEDQDTIFKTLIPLITLSSLQIIVAQLNLKSEKIRTLMDGKPVILIHNGIIDQSAMKKERYNLDDLMMQVREFGVGSIHEIAYAILETNGRLSVLKLSDCKVKYPFPIIQDGILQKDAFQKSGCEMNQVVSAMKKNGIKKIEDVFLCVITKSGFSFIRKNARAFSVKS